MELSYAHAAFILSWPIRWDLFQVNLRATAQKKINIRILMAEMEWQ
jgi:hypothetical protein